MIYVETNFMQTLTVPQLRALSTDAKINTWRALCDGGVPSVEEAFASAGPQEQAEHLYELMHPGEAPGAEPADRLAVYIELLENLSLTKRALREATRNLKIYPEHIEPEQLAQMHAASNEMATAMQEFSNVVALVCFV